MTDPAALDRWQRGDAYDDYVGRWSRLVAPRFLDWLASPPGLAWVDVGRGTGVLSEALLRSQAPASVLGVDLSAGFLEVARGRLADPHVRLELGDAQALPLAAGSVDRAASGLVLNFVPDPARMAAEMRRVVRPGGEVALYVWDYAARMDLMRRFWEAAAALDPAAAELDEGRRFPICQPAAPAALFRGAGLADVATCAIDVPTVFADFDDYWRPFTGAQGPAPGYCMSLREDRRSALRERLRATLPTASDGSIALTARAFAVRGRVLT
jgi:SAM-dependent methyltransferase